MRKACEKFPGAGHWQQMSECERSPRQQQQQHMFVNQGYGEQQGRQHSFPQPTQPQKLPVEHPLHAVQRVNLGLPPMEGEEGRKWSC